MAETSTGTFAEVVDETAVKQERGSLVKGPTAIILLFVIGTLALIGVGGFWTYPQYTALQRLNDEIAGEEVKNQEMEAQLAALKQANLEAKPSEREQELSQKIPEKNDPARTVRDLVELSRVDPATPDDDLKLVSFTIAQAVKQGEGVVVETTLQLKGTRKGLLSFLELAASPESGMRLAIPIQVDLKYLQAEINPGESSGSTTDIRFAHLLQQEARHVISDLDRAVLEDAKASRIATLKDLEMIRDKAVMERGLYERSKTDESQLERAEKLSALIARVDRAEEAVQNYANKFGEFQHEVDATVKLQLFYESDPSAKDAPKTAAKT